MPKTRRIPTANDNDPVRVERPAPRLRPLPKAVFKPQGERPRPRPAFKARATQAQTISRSKPAKRRAQSSSKLGWRVKELCVLLALMGGLFGLNIFASANGVTLTLIDLLAAGATAGLFLFAILRSRMALMFSLFSTASWAGVSGLSLLAGETANMSWAILLLPIIAAQLWAAVQLRSHQALMVSTLIALSWAGIWAAATAISPAAIAALTFIMGAAQHRIGKAMGDERSFGADWHGLIGWLVAVGSAMFVQQLWMKPDMDSVAMNATSLPDIWLWGVSLAAAAIFISSLIRYRHSQISLFGIFIVSAATLILPLSVFRPDLVLSLFGQVPGLKASPGFGLMIGAAIMASAVGMIINGLRRNMLSYLIIGAGMFGLQTLMILQPALASLDFAVVTILSLVVALAIGGTVAGASLTQIPPSRRSA